MVEPKGTLSIRRQCYLLSIPRRTYYYHKAQKLKKSEEDPYKHIRKLIIDAFEKDPSIGTRRMTALLKEKGHRISRKKVSQLMKELNLQAIYPRPRATIWQSISKDTTNLAKDVEITRPNQVWSADITYIRLSKGYLYAVAIVDNYSRKVLSLKLSNTLDAYFCIEAAQEAVGGKYGYPEMIHTDRGSQFVSEGFRRVFVRQDGTSSRFSYARRAQENPYVERFFRSYKYECLMLYELKTPQEVKEVSQKWVRYYNKERPHQALGYKTPDEVFYGAREFAKSNTGVVQ